MLTPIVPREKSKLSPSKGSRVEETEDLTEEDFEGYFVRMNDAINELEAFRLKIIDWNYPCE